MAPPHKGSLIGAILESYTKIALKGFQPKNKVSLSLDASTSTHLSDTPILEGLAATRHE